MPSAKPDKPLFADTDLLEEMPEGVHFREAEVWAGLESTLRHQRRRAFLLRLSAAAVLLLAIGLGWWLRPTPGTSTGTGVAMHIAPTGEKATLAQAPAPSTLATAPVEIRSGKTLSAAAQPAKALAQPATTPVEIQPAQIAQVTPADTARNVAQPAATLTAAAQSPAVPARRFRISHMNDNAPQQPMIADVPVDERNSSFLHVPGTGSAGPSPEYTEPATERRPRTLMSLFKPHQ